MQLPYVPWTCSCADLVVDSLGGPRVPPSQLCLVSLVGAMPRLWPYREPLLFGLDLPHVRLTARQPPFRVGCFSMHSGVVIPGRLGQRLPSVRTVSLRLPAVVWALASRSALDGRGFAETLLLHCELPGIGATRNVLAV